MVVEAGGYFNEADFNQYELWAWQNLYWRGGPTPTADANVIDPGGLVPRRRARSSTGRTASARRRGSARNGRASTGLRTSPPRLRPPSRRRLEAAQRQRRMLRHERTARGDEARRGGARLVVRDHQPQCRPRHVRPGSAPATWASAIRSGSKQSTLKTYLPDAVAAGARIVTGCFVERVLVDGGRAAGVAGRSLTTGAQLTVRAPQVVVAAGSLESPGRAAAVRHRRSGRRAVPAPASVHRRVRLLRRGHAGVVGRAARRADRRVRRRRRRPRLPDRGGSVHDRARRVGDPVRTAAQHKQSFEDFRHASTFIGLLRDRGGTAASTLDETGMACRGTR